MPRKRKSRIYWRTRGDVPRAYGDFRDLGGGLEPLTPRGERYATTDPDVAADLAAARVKQLEKGQRRRNLHGTEERGLYEFAAHHLAQKAKSGRVTSRWLVETEQRLRVAMEYFGVVLVRDGKETRLVEDVPLSSVALRGVQRFANWLAEQPNGRGGTYSGKTQLEYLISLGNLFRRAEGESVIPPGGNPVSALMDKPRPARSEARWLEVWEAAVLLESARSYRPHQDPQFPAIPFMYPLLATFLLTGGRKSEVLGLEVDDLSFDRKTVTFRPNRWRRLKTSTSHRTVRMWPQMEAALRPYVFGGTGPAAGLLFPSPRLVPQGMVWDLRKAIDAIGGRAGWKPGEITTKQFRHTFTAARLQCLDRGHPVSPYQVSKELGHGGDQLVRRVYGHLGEVRHRSEELEYRTEQHQDAARERLELLRSGG